MAEFYDPYYRPGGMPRTHAEETSMTRRRYDDFSVFNILHLSKSKSLSLNNTSMLEGTQSPYPSPRQRGGGVVPLQCNELQGLPEIVTQIKLELHVNFAYGTHDDEDATSNSLGQGGHKTVPPWKLLSFCPVSILGVDIPSPIMPTSQGLKLLSVGIIASWNSVERERGLSFSMCMKNCMMLYSCRVFYYGLWRGFPFRFLATTRLAIPRGI